MPFPKILRVKMELGSRGLIIVVGVILLLIGSVLIYSGPSTETKSLPEKTASLQQDYAVEGDRTLVKSFEFNPGVVEGKFTANKPLEGFYLLDEENYQIWRHSEEEATFILKKENVEEYAFNITIRKAGTYRFIFDNRDHESEREISFQYTARWRETSTEQNWIPVYTGVALLIVGGGLVAFAIIKLRRKPIAPVGRLYAVRLPCYFNG
ncbi:MAG: hypothetical protein QXW18_06230 [Candidatus Bathyarchaeia archaeon]